ncbi:MAG: Omp28-related outer membrane protein [Polaribacter sp.]|uniref:Omp28-related outer membrane protein n=1 Tax=Polaribacter sp. TaxID=1920175 RepID=UPI002F35BD9E
MKTTKFYKFITFFALLLIMSCSSPEGEPTGSGTGSGSGSGSGETPPTSITLTSDKNNFDSGGTANFTVKTNQNTNVTSQAAIKVNGAAITGSTYTPSTHGVFKVSATFSSLTSNELTITVNEVITVTSVAITADVSSAKTGDIITFSSEVTLSDGSKVDKTSDSEFSVDGTVLTGNKYIADKVGDVKAKSVYNNVTSNEIIISISEVSTPTTYTKKAVIEDYTGTWCGWCPRVSYAIGLVEAQTDKVFAIAAHVANSEPMENDASKALRSAFGVSSFPTAYVNRASEWSYPEPSNVDQAVNQAKGNTNAGLAISSLLSGTTLDIVISTGFTQNLAGTKLVVFILEDKVIYNQSNYTSYYAGADPIVGFEHNHVLRYATTDVLGDPTSATTGIHHKSFSTNLGLVGIANVNNTAVIAMLVDASGKVVLNAQYAKVNIRKDFD